MPSAAALRFQIESALEARIPGALTPRARIVRDLASTAVPELDALLEGGLPVGAISELVGPQSSGRTTLAMATLAEMTQAGKTVAWIDTSDALDPESAAAAGVDLSRQLWVRCGKGSSPLGTSISPLSARQTGAALLVEGSRTPAPGGGGGSPHPRGEARGMPQAIDAFFQPEIFARTLPPRFNGNQSRKDRSIGTPGAPNRKLLAEKPIDRTPQDARPFPRRARDREEQIPTDRQPSRRQMLHAQQARQAVPKSLQAAQIANTLEAVQARSQAGHWSDNANNAHGRALSTPPNAIADGLQRFREMGARTTGQGGSSHQNAVPWKPSATDMQLSPLADGASTLSQSSQAPQQQTPDPASGPGTQQTGKRTKSGSNCPTSLAGERPVNLGKGASPIWQALDQALRATDLLLAAGGFSALVLDLGSVPPEFAWRIPLATWFRFRAAADRARTVLLVLTQYPCARSSAELVLRFAPAESQSASTVLTGAQFHISIDRRRFDSNPTPKPAPHSPTSAPHRLHLVPLRKQPQRETTWQRAAAWAASPQTGTEPPNTAQGGHQA